MRVVGIDLSGPSNTMDTGWVAFDSGSGRLHYLAHGQGADDTQLIQLVAEWAAEGPLTVGLDSPLSYEPGGGYRNGDRMLQKQLIGMGFMPGSVMVPTMTRMVYLTLRGMAVARALELSCPSAHLRIAEVHPGGALAMSGVPVEVVREIKSSEEARRHVLRQISVHLVSGLPGNLYETDHQVAACGAAIGAWRWKNHSPAWCHKASPPLHPYDYIC